MRAIGNGSAQRCAENLLATVRGEVPYDRLKGLDARVVDKPYNEAQSLIQQDAEWVLDTYEPRGTVKEITVAQGESFGGLYDVTAKLE